MRIQTVTWRRFQEAIINEICKHFQKQKNFKVKMVNGSSRYTYLKEKFYEVQYTHEK